MVAEHPRRIQWREKKLLWISPFHAGRRIVLIMKTLTSMFEQLPICDLGVVLINYHAIEISRLLYNCLLWMVSVSKQTFLREMNHSVIHFDRKLYHCRYSAAIGFNLVTISIQVNYVYRPLKKLRAISSNLNQNLNKRQCASLKKRLNDIYSLKENNNSVHTFKEVCS